MAPWELLALSLAAEKNLLNPANVTLLRFPSRGGGFTFGGALNTGGRSESPSGAASRLAWLCPPWSPKATPGSRPCPRLQGLMLGPALGEAAGILAGCPPTPRPPEKGALGLQMPCLPPGPRPSCNGPGKCLPLMSKPPASFPQTCHMPVNCSQSPQVPSPRVGQYLPAARRSGGCWQRALGTRQPRPRGEAQPGTASYSPALHASHRAAALPVLVCSLSAGAHPTAMPTATPCECKCTGWGRDEAP